MDITILGIESSCDDTSAAVIRNNVLLSNVIASQAVHIKYGGVIPRTGFAGAPAEHHPRGGHGAQGRPASTPTDRRHRLHARPRTAGFAAGGRVVRQGAFDRPQHPDGRGQPPSGTHTLTLHRPSGPHAAPLRTFRFLCLLVSGGHTQIVRVDSPARKWRSSARRSTTPRAKPFDKCAKVMGLPYPGGPVIDKLAKEGDPKAFRFAHPRVEGLRLFVLGPENLVPLHAARRRGRTTPVSSRHNKASLCASLQRRSSKILLDKLVRASKDLGIRDIAIAGGVSANSTRTAQRHRRAGAGAAGARSFRSSSSRPTTPAMIAMAGYHSASTAVSPVRDRRRTLRAHVRQILQAGLHRPPLELRYLRVLHRNLAGETLLGELVRNEAISGDLLEIFPDALRRGLPHRTHGADRRIRRTGRPFDAGQQLFGIQLPVHRGNRSALQPQPGHGRGHQPALQPLCQNERRPHGRRPPRKLPHMPNGSGFP